MPLARLAASYLTSAHRRATKAALALAKARGKALGEFRARAGTCTDLAKARAARSAKAASRANLARYHPTASGRLDLFAQETRGQSKWSPSGGGRLVWLA